MDVEENTTVHGNASDTQPITHSVWEVVTIATVSAIVSLITIIGNILVMLSFKVNSQLKTVNNYYLLSLAFADLIIGVFSMNLYTSYILMGYWSLGSLACDLWLALDYVASNASVMNLLVISFDRYFSITRPLTYRAKRTPKRAGVMIGLAWLISLILWAPPILCWQYFVGERTVPPRQCQIQFFSEPVITFGTAIAAFYVPVSIMTILYCRIYKETERRTKDLAELQGLTTSAQFGSAKPQKNIGSCFGCNRPTRSTHKGNQVSWSSSSQSTAARPTVASHGEWFRSDQANAFNSYSSSEDDGRPVSTVFFQAAQMDQAIRENEASHARNLQLSSYEEGSRSASPPKHTSQRSKKGISYKFRLVQKDSSPQTDTNGQTKTAPSSCSVAASISQSSRTIDLNLKNQISKRKRLVLIKEKKAAQTLSAILLAFIVTWTPYNIMVLISTFCSDCVPLSLWHLGYWLCYVNSTINPMCYALCNKTFQKTFRTLLLCQWKNGRGQVKLHWTGQNSVMGSKTT